MNEDRPSGGERAILVHLHLRDKTKTADFQEFRELALSAGAEIVAAVTCNRDTPDSKYFVGSGKAEELRSIVAAEKAEIALFDHNLTPSQERNLESILKCRVLDRTGLILDIFASRARTFEGKLQVELAQLKHHSTRLIRGWTHLERQKGGIGLRGPGETQLEVDRRLIRGKIKHITARLEKVRSQREQGRRGRRRALLPTVSLVGYTNAGKSTLFNQLTGAKVFVANQLFATLDPTLRAVEFQKWGKLILADTVGFVSNLPHDLVEAFRATLEEVKDSDLLLHIIDAHDESWRNRVQEVEGVLAQIGAETVPRIEVYNKIDLLPQGNQPHCERNEAGKIHRVAISARLSQGFDLLEKAIVEQLSGKVQKGTLDLPPTAAKLRASLYDLGVVIQESQSTEESGGWKVDFEMPQFKWQELLREEPNLVTYCTFLVEGSNKSDHQDSSDKSDKLDSLENL